MSGYPIFQEYPYLSFCKFRPFVAHSYDFNSMNWAFLELSEFVHHTYCGFPLLPAPLMLQVYEVIPDPSSQRQQFSRLPTTCCLVLLRLSQIFWCVPKQGNYRGFFFVTQVLLMQVLCLLSTLLASKCRTCL